MSSIRKCYKKHHIHWSGSLTSAVGAAAVTEENDLSCVKRKPQNDVVERISRFTENNFGIG